MLLMTDSDNQGSQTGLNAYSTPPESNIEDNPSDALSLGLQLLAADDGAETISTPGEGNEQARQKHIDNIEAFLGHIHAQWHSRHRVFRDWIDLVLTALQGDEETYQQTAERYESTTNYDRDDDRHPLTLFSNALGDLMAGVEKTNRDLLGDVYMTIGEQSDELAQHFTPHAVSDLLAANVANGTMDGSDSSGSSDGPLPELTGKSIADPACGSGRLLLGVARQLEQDSDVDSFWVYGKDLDSVCAKMTVINLYLHGVNGIVVHGDSLKMSAHNAWAVLHTPPLGGRIEQLPADAFDMGKSADS